MKETNLESLLKDWVVDKRAPGGLPAPEGPTYYNPVAFLQDLDPAFTLNAFGERAYKAHHGIDPSKSLFILRFPF